jgi:2-polyprenyl-3-methyl-5-hydroxy-6-metoxy-1,4-benzoquinol methylase
MKEMAAKSPREALEAAYQALSPFSEADRWEFESHLRHIEFVLKEVAQKPTMRVIDVGCYIGIVPLTLRMLGVDARGNDKYIFYPRETGKAYGLSSHELETLKSIWGKYGLVVSAFDATEGHGEGDYDIVLSIATIEHQPFPKEFLEGVAKFARKGGLIYIATPNGAKLANRVRCLLGRPLLSNIEEFYMNGRTFNGHWREYTCGELRAMTRMSGLTVISCKATQMEPITFRWRTPTKWSRSIARLLAHAVPGTGDINVSVARK